MRPLLFVLSFLTSLALCSSSSATEFRIGDYRALALSGEARLLPDVHYVSFTGDYGFAGRLPSKKAINRHVAQESSLLGNFHLKVINLEFMLPGSSGNELDRQIDRVVLDILKRTRYDVISLANNHAMDYGREGVHYNTRLLQQAGYPMIGTRDLPVYNWKPAGATIAIFSLTDYTDKPDPEGLILKINKSDLDAAKRDLSSADFRIAFVHLGSMSFYPSPHERAQVARILEAGADLVICTGSHFTKGFVYEKDKPVVYDIGNHLLSSLDSFAEPVGMHFVAGFRKGALVQLFAVPFHNAIFSDKTGGLDEIAFASFQEKLLDRSTSDFNRFYSDPSSLKNLKERLGRFSLEKLKSMRARHVVYAAGILYNHYPVIVIGSCLFVITAVIFFVRWASLRPKSRR